MYKNSWKKTMLIMLLCLACVLAGCAAKEEKANPAAAPVATDADKYAQAQQDLRNGQYETAIPAFRKAGNDKDSLAKQRSILSSFSAIVSAGVLHTVGLKEDGTVVAAGRDADGQCNVYDWKNIAVVAAGGEGLMLHRADAPVASGRRRT